MTIGHDDDQQNYICIIESSANIDYYIANVVTVSMSIHYFYFFYYYGYVSILFPVVDLVSYHYDAVLLDVFLDYVDRYGDEITINDYIDFTGQVVHYIFHDVDCGDELYVFD